MNQSTTSIINYDSNNLKNIDHHKYDCKKIFYISKNKSKNKKIVYQHPYFGPIFTRQNEAYIHVRDMHPKDWIRGHLKEEHIDTVYTPSDNEVG